MPPMRVGAVSSLHSALPTFAENCDIDALFSDPDVAYKLLLIMKEQNLRQAIFLDSVMARYENRARGVADVLWDSRA